MAYRILRIEPALISEVMPLLPKNVKVVGSVPSEGTAGLVLRSVAWEVLRVWGAEPIPEIIGLVTNDGSGPALTLRDPTDTGIDKPQADIGPEVRDRLAKIGERA